MKGTYDHGDSHRGEGDQYSHGGDLCKEIGSPEKSSPIDMESYMEGIIVADMKRRRTYDFLPDEMPMFTRILEQKCIRGVLSFRLAEINENIELEL